MGASRQKITVRPRGPYLVRGGVPLVRASRVLSELGEPIDWKRGEVLPTEEAYRLCRCGQSGRKPFCDGTHTLAGFDGTETADAGPIADRQVDHRGAGIVLKDDRSLCASAGYCGNKVTTVWKMIEKTADPAVREQLMAMVERCPSGRLSYALEGGKGIPEPDLPREIGVVADGPLWVRGGIPVERRDGQPVETRDRMTLCRCGGSGNKPFCDGTHKKIGFREG